jgi:CRISPR-associated protein (TIGR03986 family)
MTREDVASIDPMVREDVIEVSRQALEVWWEAHRGGGYSEKDWSVVIDGVTINLSRPDARRLRHAYPVFYREGEQGITYLSVIRGGRNAVTTIPPERYPHGLPADEDDGLDAARRMFGRVPAADAPDDDTQSAWAGRIRFGPVHYEGGAQTKEFTLKPLMSPKVQSAGHYLQSDAKDGGVAWSPGKPGRLAGTKVYWHQPPIAVPGAEMDVAERVSEVATIKGTDGADARMKTNRTVEALVDGSFRFDIWFEDLDEGELGALLLAASLRFVDVGRVGWRIGLARPLGFGSVVNVIEQVDVVAPSGPTSLVLRRMDDEAISSRLSQARERWFGVESVELAVAGGIASLDSFIDMSFGYPGLKSGRYNPKNQTYQARPSAREELSKRPAAQPPKGA